MQTELQFQPETSATDAFDDIIPAEVKTALEEPAPSANEIIASMEEEAKRAAETYETELTADDSGFMGGELGEMLNQNEMQSQYREAAECLRIPQFYLQSVPDLFGDEYGAS